MVGEEGEVRIFGSSASTSLIAAVAVSIPTYHLLPFHIVRASCPITFTLLGLVFSVAAAGFIAGSMFQLRLTGVDSFWQDYEKLVGVPPSTPRPQGFSPLSAELTPENSQIYQAPQVKDCAISSLMVWYKY